MNGFLGFTGTVVALGAIVGATYMGTYNGFMRKDEGIKAAERNIANCYQKRADLLPNLEAVVNKYVQHERGTFNDVTQARAQIGKMSLPENATPEQRKEFEEALKANQSALSRLLAVSENYPQLKADTQFTSLQRTLTDTERQCAVLRTRYIETVRGYNASIRSFPSNVVAGMHGLTSKDQLQFDDEAQNKKSPKLFKQ